jgi:hypothetical protein
MESFSILMGKIGGFAGRSRSWRWKWLVVVSQTAGASDVNNQHLLDNHQTRSPSTGDITYGHQGGRMKNLANSNFCLLAIWPVTH